MVGVPTSEHRSVCYLQDLSKDPLDDGGTDTKIALPESFRAGTTVPPRAHHPSFSQNSAEQIRRREVTRILKTMNPSPEEQEAIERLSHLLVAKLLLGPISAIMHNEIWASQGGRHAKREASKNEWKGTFGGE
jgi:hypothetical protein